MAARTGNDRPALPYTPPNLSTQDVLLASRFSLPQNPIICYAILTSPSVDAIEQTRRSIVARYVSSPIQDSIFTTVHIGHDPCIYLFKLAQQPSSPDVFGTLDLYGLTVHQTSSFPPPSASTLLPDPERRILVAYFLDAVRSRLIQDIITASSKKPSSTQRLIRRFKNGILISQTSSSSCWEYRAITRPLVFCQLEVHFSYTSDGIPSHLVIHPILLPTPFLDISPSLPLPPGTPITLLPFGTPAYFLACYTGPSAGLAKQFHTALQGLGAGDWDDPSSTQSPTFIIGWIKVENKLGEDKGLTVIYPTKLCLLYLPFSSSRAPLDYIPDLPTPLQPSPQASEGCMSFGRARPVHAHRPYFITSPTSESLHSFRALTLSSRDLRQVTVEVGGYIHSVVRERERERERLRREREIGTSSSPRTTRTSSTTPATATATSIGSIEQSTSSSSTISSVPPTSCSVLSSSSRAHPPSPPSNPPSTTMQTFYPSPPESNPTLPPPIESKTSPAADTSSASDPSAATMEPLPKQPPPSSGGSSFDPYAMDQTWARPADADGYLGMDIDNMDFVMNDMNLNFNLDMGTLANASSTAEVITSFNGRDGTANNTTGIEFEDAFTDDDFSFFDQPSKPNAPPPAREFAGLHARSASGPHSMMSPSNLLGSGMSSPNFVEISTLHSTSTQLWTPGGFMEGFTPRSLVDNIDSAPPELLPSSPGRTPDSHSVPATPNVHLEFIDPSIKRPVTVARGSNTSASLFEPIPFASYHREADGKYAMGKFALPSPPPEDDFIPSDVGSISLPASPSAFTLSKGWKFKYNAVTDPRIGLVKKLIGVKRKLPSVAAALGSPPPKKALWDPATQDWESSREEDDAKGDNGDSDMDSAEEDEDLEDNESITESRPTTPPPSYLPLGPTLLCTHFQHAYLLPLSVPLRPPGSAVDPLNLSSNSTHPPPSVPTPVSPAATMGAAWEKSRSLEAAASAVAVEVVENPLWAETWKANAVGAKIPGALWSTDIQAIKKSMERVPGLEVPLTMSMLLELEDAEDDGKRSATDSKSKSILPPMEAPMISIGKGEAIIQVLPPALRFWEKLGLNPKGGCKDVTAFVIFEDDGHKEPSMANWLTSFGNAYQGKHYGQVTPGQSSVCTSDGLVPLRFDATFRKSLGNLISSLTSSNPTTVVFLVLPINVMTLSSPVLRQILSASKKVLANYSACQVLFQFIPEQHIYTGLQKLSAYDSSLDVLSSSVYNRILVPVDRLGARQVSNFDDGKDDVRSYFMAPSFTLARPIHNQVSFVRAAHTSLDVMDRYTLLHVGYHLTPCGKWITACCIDQRGENYELEVWLTLSPGDHEAEPEQSTEDYAVKKVWDFAMQFVRKTNIEWRVVFAKLGALTLNEVNAWNTHLNLHVTQSREQPPLHHSLVCFVPDAPWFFIPSKLGPSTLTRSLSSSKQPIVFTDVSSTTYAIFPNARIPVSIPLSQTDLVSNQPHIPEPSTPHASSATASSSAQHTTTVEVGQQPLAAARVLHKSCSERDRHSVPLLPHSTSLLIRVPHPNSTTTTMHTTMTNIHLLKTCHSATYIQPTSAVSNEKQLLADITRNYYELSVLSKARWKLDGVTGNKGLPFHLAAVDAMRMALDKDWDRSESTTGP